MSTGSLGLLQKGSVSKQAATGRASSSRQAAALIRKLGVAVFVEQLDISRGNLPLKSMVFKRVDSFHILSSTGVHVTSGELTQQACHLGKVLLVSSYSNGEVVLVELELDGRSKKADMIGLFEFLINSLDNVQCPRRERQIILVGELHSIDEELVLFKLNQDISHAQGSRFNVRKVGINGGTSMKIKFLIMKHDQVAFPMERFTTVFPAAEMGVWQG